MAILETAFSKEAPYWWDTDGPYAILHALNPLRVVYLRDKLALHFGRDLHSDRPLAGLKILDIGCGGGLLSVALAHLGAKVTGVDEDPVAIAVAQDYAQEKGLSITYHQGQLETLLLDQEFDVVLMMEVLEHVNSPALLIQKASTLVTQEGFVGFSTLNRTRASKLLGIRLVEDVLGWVPQGTHSWDQFLTPLEVENMLMDHDIMVKEFTGFGFNPKTQRFGMSDALCINYMGWGTKTPF